MAMSIKYVDKVDENMLEEEVYNVENRSRLNVDRLNKSRNVVVRVAKNSLLEDK